MYGKAVLVIATTVIILLMLFGNAKVRVFSVLVNQIKVFKNAKTEKLSWWDIVCFYYYANMFSNNSYNRI